MRALTGAGGEMPAGSGPTGNRPAPDLRAERAGKGLTSENRDRRERDIMKDSRV
jgi:hypothetical protein